MKPREDETLARMHYAPTEQALFDALRTEARRLGFDHCAYGLRLPLNWSKPRFVLFNNYPAAWQDRYLSEDYAAIDPTIQHAHRSLLPLIWCDEVFSETQEFWEDARSHGLRYGWAQPCMGSQGILGMLTLSRSHEPLSKVELNERGHQIAWLTQVAHECMSRLISSHTYTENTTNLSLREVDVLRWTAEGKTSGEIAKIMNITVRTVNFHVSNSLKKLNCVNKTAAVVKAALTGLLS